MTAGEMRYSVSVLTDEGFGIWKRGRVTYAKVEEQGRMIAYSSVATKAPQYDIWVRKQDLRRGMMLAMGEMTFLILTAEPEGTAFLHLTCACVTRTACSGGEEIHPKSDGFSVSKPTFVSKTTCEGVLAEKYQRGGMEDGIGQTETGYVLIVPPSATLQPGMTVEVGGHRYFLTCCHDLDPTRVEWEMTRRTDN